MKSFKNKEEYAYLTEKTANSTCTPAAPPALPVHTQQHRANIMGYASEYRPGLTPSGNGFSSGGSVALDLSGFGATPSVSFGGSAASGQSGSTPTGSGFSFGGSAASGQSGFGVKPSVSFGGSAASGQSGFGANPSVSFGGSAASGQSGSTPQVAQHQPPPPNNKPFPPEEQLYKLFDQDFKFKIEDHSKNDKKRKGDSTELEGGEKKSKPPTELPQLGGQGLFQYVYSFVQDSTGKTGVKQTNSKANDIWNLASVKARRTYFDKLAKAFKTNCLDNNVTRGASFDKKRNALAKRLSEIADMCTEEEGKWKAPTESHDSLFK